MENISPTLGVEDGITEVECLLLEPQGGHVSMDSVLRFDEKIPHNTMCMKDVSPGFAQSNAAITSEVANILRGEVLDGMHTGTEVCYLQLQNDFCTMGEDYFLGVEFAESITYLDQGSSESLHASVSDSSLLTSSADADMPWKSDCLRIMEVPEYQNDQLNLSSSEVGEIQSCHDAESFVENSLKSPKSSYVQNIGKFQDVWSSCSYQDVFPDLNDGSLSPSGNFFCSSKILENDKCGVMSKGIENYQIHEEDSSAMTAGHVSQTDALPALKRARKVTQRYIDELAITLSRHPTRKRNFSSLAGMPKSQGVNNHKTCHVKSRMIRLPAEESSVRAIQVPFCSLVQKESQKKHAFDVIPKQGATGKSKEHCTTLEKKKKRNSITTTVRQKKGENFTMAAVQREKDCVTEAHPAETNYHNSEACLKTRDGYAIHKINPKERDVHVAVTLQKRDVCLRAARCKKKDDYYYSTESPEEVIHRRKHHRLWTISEVRKLIDGISQYGVGRWSRIKKLFFPTSVHRTSVDIKDKWRNLLKASGIQEQNKRQGEKRRNMAWRPLPKPILRRVCELAIMYPYPKGQKPKIAHFHRISSGGSTDITLRDYIRIARSVNGN
ncbi:uncharacterized protein [Henckelia pumila]|uniref:uncharacterized protein n=1 Tax=Henckelia pumila TaxID=405737 RepID=UPI003C6E3451